jgi:hypothetical protein
MHVLTAKQEDKQITAAFSPLVPPPPLLTVSRSLRYDGDFQNDMKCGFGVLQYSNGEKYEVRTLDFVFSRIVSVDTKF